MRTLGKAVGMLLNPTPPAWRPVARNKGLYIHCSEKIQQLIREHAQKEHRSIGSYVLQVVLSHIEMKRQMSGQLAASAAHSINFQRNARGKSAGLVGKENSLRSRHTRVRIAGR